MYMEHFYILFTMNNTFKIHLIRPGCLRPSMPYSAESWPKTPTISLQGIIRLIEENPVRTPDTLR